MQVLNKKMIDFDFDKFKPKWWAWNTHIQTIVASLFSKVQQLKFKRVEISTPDDDFLEIDVATADSDKPIVALFHGLEGSTERYYINNLMHSLHSAGFSSAALNFRGCGSRLNNQRRFYHSGETESYEMFFDWIAENHPQKHIYAIGFSLGANTLIKYLGEREDHSLVKRAVAISPPYDLKKGSLQLHEGFNRIYEINFLKTLVEKLEMKRRQFSDMPTFSGNSLYEYDNQVTAPLHGFKDADDYYHQCSCKHYFEDVQIPLLLIHSKDDTLCPIEYAPIEKIKKNPHIHVIFTEQGGHVGFLSSPEGWMNRTILKWLER
ncbi:MAG: alpha/beta fold hydrolase [Balneolaceae bacterium]